jgi:hypothetical protein
MTVLVKISLPARAFRLARTLERHRGITVEFESVVPLMQALRPRLWIRGIDPERVPAVLQDDPEITHATVHVRTSDEALVSVEWTGSDPPILRTIDLTDATCLRCLGRDGSWHVTLRFPDRDDLTEFHADLTDHDFPVWVHSVRDRAAGADEYLLDRLTDAQYETLCTALRTGYFSVPRRTTLQELAEELGVSDTAASKRIRRGLEALLAEELRAPTRERPTGLGRT